MAFKNDQKKEIIIILFLATFLKVGIIARSCCWKVKTLLLFSSKRKNDS